MTDEHADHADERGYGLLSAEEVERLVMNLLKTRRRRGATADEIEIVLKWGHTAVVDKTCLEGVLADRIAVDVADGEIVFLPAERR